ncbi:putative transporter [Cryptosporidium canis]|uniref:Transporter n=1 Tax=Cryptosporidium canis TaxID=195482 RepID=A0A9D5DE54_9CRYT|nr:putative transporter [Cryptosporidium canis]
MLTSLFKIASLLGGLSLNIALGMVYSMSNSSIYVASYMRWVTGPGAKLVTLADISWVYTLNVFFLGVMLPVGGYINKKIGVRLSLYLASTLFSVSTFISYWFVSSYYWFLIIFGCVIGIADGIAFNLPQYCAYRHFPNNIGLASSVVISGLALSPILFSPLQTWIVNPDNKMPDLMVGNALYFSDEEILARVPRMFMAMGLFTTSLCIISIFTMYEPEEDSGPVLPSRKGHDEAPHPGNDVPGPEEDLFGRFQRDGLRTESRPLLPVCDCERGGSNHDEAFLKTSSESASTSITPTEELPSLTFDMDAIRLELELEQEEELEQDGKPGTPDACGQDVRLRGSLVATDSVELDVVCRLLRERQFWLVFWLIFFFSQYVHFIASWWKNIGIIHLNISDELLATFGTLITAGNNVFGRCFFGSWIDKFGGRICFIIISLSCLASVAVFQLSLVLNSMAFYFICIGFIFFNMGAGFVLFPPIVAIHFGVEYYTLIYGIIYIGRSLGVLFNSFLTWLFIGSVSIHVICLVIAIFTFAFFFLSTKFHDEVQFSDPTLHEELFVRDHPSEDPPVHPSHSSLRQKEEPC